MFEFIVIAAFLFFLHKQNKKKNEKPQTDTTNARNSSPQVLSRPNGSSKEYESMSDSELIAMANTNDSIAIFEYASRLFNQKQYTEARSWYLKGAQTGDPDCMELYAQLTLMEVYVLIQNESSAVSSCINELRSAERWLMKAFNAGNQNAKQLLFGSNGIYDNMVWCNYIAGCQNNDSSFFNNAITYYGRIKAKPSSLARLGYILSLEKMGALKKAVLEAIQLVDRMDDTLGNDHKFLLYSMLAKAYFEGNCIAPNYDKALYYTQKLRDLATDDEEIEAIEELLFYFSSGEARSDFNQARKQQILSAVVRGLRN